MQMQQQKNLKNCLYNVRNAAILDFYNVYD